MISKIKIIYRTTLKMIFGISIVNCNMVNCTLRRWAQDYKSCAAGVQILRSGGIDKISLQKLFYFLCDLCVWREIIVSPRRKVPPAAQDL